jgi:predicted N-formylglutamate amidohydrolase
MPEISEITHIPGNRNLTPADRLARIHRIYRPFHAAIAELLDCGAAKGVRSMVVTVSGFTPVYNGTPRAAESGILHDRDTRVSEKLIATFSDVHARLNEPYGRRTACCTRSICMRHPAASRTS